MKTRILTLTLALLLFAGAFTGCGEVAEPEITTAAEALTTAPEASETAEETTSMYGTLGEKDWGGRDFNVLGLYKQYETSFEIDFNEDDGDVLHSAVFKRNSEIEELFKVNINQVGDAASYSKFTIDVQAGEANYDIAFLYRDEMSNAISKQLMKNLLNYSEIDFSQPYYNTNTLESMKINGKLFHMVSDFSLVDKNRIAALYVNRDMERAYQIPDIIETVTSGNWTFDKFAEYVIATSSDLNGDGKMTYTDDQFGLTMGADDEAVTFFSAMGGMTVTQNGGGEYEFTYNSAYCEEIATVSKKIFTNKNYYFPSASSDGYAGATACFKAGRALFCKQVIKSLAGIAKESEFAFSVLPLPKYNTDQKDYYSTNNNPYCASFGIPITAPDPEFSAFMIEALSWKSTNSTLLTYRELYCKARNSYDYDCAKMLDILFDSLIYDFGLMNGSALNSIPSATVNSVMHSNSASLASLFTANKKNQNSLLKKLLESINAEEK